MEPMDLDSFKICSMLVDFRNRIGFMIFDSLYKFSSGVIIVGIYGFYHLIIRLMAMFGSFELAYPFNPICVVSNKLELFLRVLN